MRALLALASIGLALSAFSATPALAGGDDSLPYWAPYRGPSHCHRLFWRERCGPYRLGGYFERRYRAKRVVVIRRTK